MTIVAETPAQSQLTGQVHEGLRAISEGQTVTFTRYTKQIVSQDMYVFWAATTTTVTVKGSLHYGTERDQDEDQTIGINAVIFASEEQVTEFNAVGLGEMWISDWPVGGGSIQIAFSSQTAFYEQAGTWHYAGFAVYPALKSQIISSAADLPVGPIVSNSLPIWIGLPANIGSSVPLLAATVYPAFLVPENLVPPYIVANIEETHAIQAFAHMDWSQRVSPSQNLYELPSYQLMKDRVVLTFYGFTNQQVIQYFSALRDYSYNTDTFGFLNFPAIQDEKRTQPEIAAIAMKKTIQIDASYYQSTADAVARRLILSAAITIN